MRPPASPSPSSADIVLSRNSPKQRRLRPHEASCSAGRGFAAAALAAWLLWRPERSRESTWGVPPANRALRGQGSFGPLAADCGLVRPPADAVRGAGRWQLRASASGRNRGSGGGASRRSTSASPPDAHCHWATSGGSQPPLSLEWGTKWRGRRAASASRSSGSEEWLEYSTCHTPSVNTALVGAFSMPWLPGRLTPVLYRFSILPICTDGRMNSGGTSPRFCAADVMRRAASCSSLPPQMCSSVPLGSCVSIPSGSSIRSSASRCASMSLP
mmetsp:Transcript_3153/g.7834  ORF Transcript_3153/g.7834 Transcript_3153/m.7834 type:complete len:272 (-) Transcript_3153:269-1084(-)